MWCYSLCVVWSQRLFFLMLYIGKITPFTNLNILTICQILINVYWFSGISDMLTFKTVAPVFNPMSPSKIHQFPLKALLQL